MHSAKVRLNSPTVAILTSNDKGPKVTIVTIPSDAEITVLNSTAEGDGLVAVECNEQMVLMFAQDIRERGTRIDAANPMAPTIAGEIAVFPGVL